MNARGPSVVEIAVDYLRRGWRVIPVRARAKRPLNDDWPHLEITPEAAPRYFGGDTNIGVILGDGSSGLVDIDLDCTEALALASRFLPPTMIFGRASKPRSHWLYTAPGARTEKFSAGGKAGQMLVELRANAVGGGEGLQTVFPGSVHESGEAVAWDPSSAREPTAIKPEELRARVAQLAVAAALGRAGWPHERAAAAVESKDLRAAPDMPYALAARWLGLPARTQQRTMPDLQRPRADDNRVVRASAYLARIGGATSGEGGHQQTWAAALAMVRGFDLSEGEAFSLLSREYNPRCTPPWSERELRHKIVDALNNAHVERGYLLRQDRTAGGPPRGDRAQSSNPETLAPKSDDPAIATGGWEPPVEFDTFDVPPFPVDALPPALAEFVAACAEATQTPPDLAGMLVLAASAAACAKRLEVEIKPGYREPANLFVAVVLPPAERKSAVMREVTAPLIAWEAKEAEQVAPQITRMTQRWAMSKKRLEAAIDRAAKAKTKGEREPLELEVEELSEDHSKIVVPVEPRILADDATPEALASLLAQHGGRIAIFSAEGGVFQQMAGKYSETPSLDVYLKAHAGDEIRVDRKGRPSERVADPALTLGLAIQPSVLEALAEKPMLRGTGLVARFLYALPTSMLGARRIDAPPIPEPTRAAYASVLSRLLGLQQLDHPVVLKFSREAYLSWCEFAAEVEPKLGEFGEFDSIRDWAGKLLGATSRISGILSILATFSLNSLSKDPSISIYIDESTLQRAIKIARYLIPHAQAAITKMGADAQAEAAKHVLRCLRRKAWTSFSRRELHRHLQGSEQFREAEALDRPLALLVERNFLRPQTPSMRGVGRPASPTYEINPEWIARSQKNVARIDKTPSQSIRGCHPIPERQPGEDDE